MIFFSPTIEIFNKFENPTTIDQNQEQKKDESKKILINQQQF